MPETDGSHASLLQAWRRVAMDPRDISVSLMLVLQIERVPYTVKAN